MLISSFPLPPTGGQAPEKRHFGLTFSQRATGPQGRPFCVDSVLLVTKSSKKQRLK